MAQFETRTETSTRQIWSLTIPTNLVEVEKVHSAILQHAKQNDITLFDDSVAVEADEEELRFVLTSKG